MQVKVEKQKGRDAILLAAERLLAEYGMHGASLRQISEAAGQKNPSAIHYHFGSREQLIEAVFIHRMEGINPKRVAWLERLKQQDKLQSIRDLVCVMVWPLAEEIHPREDGNFYVQFLVRANREQLLTIEIAPIQLLTGWLDALKYLKENLSFLPEPIATARLRTASEQCLYGLAEIEAEKLGGSSDFNYRVESLIDMISGGLQAPVSPATFRALPKEN